MEDNKLREILIRVPTNWENYDKIQELAKALDSNNKFYKQCIIKKYEQNN